MSLIDEADDLVDLVSDPLPLPVQCALDDLVRDAALEDEAIDCSGVTDDEGRAEMRERWAEEMNALGVGEQLTYLAHQGVPLGVIAATLSPAAVTQHARIQMLSMQRRPDTASPPQDPANLFSTPCSPEPCAHDRPPPPRPDRRRS